jgi:hypothetical protein
MVEIVLGGLLFICLFIWQWNKPIPSNLKPIDSTLYCIFTLLLWIPIITWRFYVESLDDYLFQANYKEFQQITYILGIILFFIGYWLTKRRIIDTDLSYRWRIVYFLGGFSILLILFLYFKKSKNNELPSDKNEYQEQLSQIKKVADEIKAKKKEMERKKSQQKSSKSEKNELPSDKNATEIIKSQEIENPYQKYMPKEMREAEPKQEVKEKIEVVKQEEIENKDEKTEDKKSEYNSIIDELTKLVALKEKGLLTEDEFNEQKKKLLKQ